MTSPTVAGIDLMELVDSLSEAQKAALMPGGMADRRGLVKLGLAHWKQRPGQRVKSLMPTPLGYKVREILRARASLIEEERS